MLKERAIHSGAVLVVMFLFATGAAAQDTGCFRSSECASALICMNLSCMEAELESCGTDGICNSDDICHDGYCKPGGVSCSNDVGQCHADISSGGCECMSGMGSGWASGSAGDGEPDGDPPEGASDGELYAQCRQFLKSDCGEEAPDLTKSCTEAQLTTCTGFVLKYDALGQSCEEYWDDDALSSDSGSASDGDSDSSGSGGATGDEDSDLPAAGPAPDLGGDERPPIYNQQQANPWEVEECCYELQEAAEEEPEYLEQIETFLACIEALEEEDCDGLMDCEEETWGGDSGAVSDNTDREASGGGDADGDGDVDEDEDGEMKLEGNGEEESADKAGDGAGTPGSDETPKEPDDSGGCSFVPVSQGSTIVTLLKALF